MKFLLTSAGITNKSIAQAVMDLVGVPANQIHVAFVPTAADILDGDKGWLIDNLNQFAVQGYARLDIVPITALSKIESLSRLGVANLICFGGGSEHHLMKILRTTGLDKELPKLLETRVYMGISAGSMIAGHFLPPAVSDTFFPEEPAPPDPETALGLIDVVVLPHLNSSYFTNMRKEPIMTLQGKVFSRLYALDDASALKVLDSKIEVITEGEYMQI